MVFAHPTHPQRTTALRQARYNGQRLIDWTPEIKARAQAIASHYHGRLWDPPPLVNDKLFGSICVPGLQSGINW
jgi:hypothetical protein